MLDKTRRHGLEQTLHVLIAFRNFFSDTFIFHKSVVYTVAFNFLIMYIYFILDNVFEMSEYGDWLVYITAILSVPVLYNGIIKYKSSAERLESDLDKAIK